MKQRLMTGHSEGNTITISNTKFKLTQTVQQFKKQKSCQQ